MGKIISQTLETESVQEAKSDLSIEEISSEIPKHERSLTERGLTPMGYDEEIGLSEELEHRFGRVQTNQERTKEN